MVKKSIIYWGFLFAASLAVGCSSSDEAAPAQQVQDSGTQGDTSSDSPSVDTGTEKDSSSSDADTGSDSALSDSAVDTGVDAGNDVVSDVVTDPVADAVADVIFDVVTDGGSTFAGQCRVSADCKTNASNPDSCIQMWPGGFCGCSTPADCPNASTFECLASRCLKKCTVPGDCAAGLYCSASGRCMPEKCGADAGGAVCTAPYVCKSSTCVRPSCQDAGAVCPSGMHCGGGNYCVED